MSVTWNVLPVALRVAAAEPATVDQLARWISLGSVGISLASASISGAGLRQGLWRRRHLTYQQMDSDLRTLEAVSDPQASPQQALSLWETGVELSLTELGQRRDTVPYRKVRKLLAVIYSELLAVRGESRPTQEQESSGDGINLRRGQKESLARAQKAFRELERLRPPQVGLSILLRFMPRRVGRSVGGGLRGWSLV